MPKPVLGPRRRTNPLIWCAAIICSIITTAVIIGGLVVFIGYLVIKPKVPKISITGAQLDTIYFDQSNLLTIQLTILVRAENHNAKAGASFYDTNFGLTFRGKRIATLRATSFGVKANSSVEFNYVPQSGSIPLSPEEAEAVSFSLRRGGVMSFELAGRTRTRWRVWLIGSVKFWLELDCRLLLPTNGTRIDPHCSSKYK